MNRGILVGVAVGVVVIALGVGLLMRSEKAADANLPVPAASRPSSTVPAPALAPAATGTSAAPTTAPGGLPLNTPAAPWLTPGSGSAPSAAVVPPSGAGRSGAPTMAELQARLQALSSNKQPTPREVDALLADLQKNQGGNVVAGVNLQTLRDNLARTERIQQLAQEIQALAASPTADTPSQMQSRLDELQRLQAALTSNVTAPAGAAR